MPTISNYGQTQTKQHNTIRVDVGPLSVWFSYTTPVAFSVDCCKPIVRHNTWGQTTGKHLNIIDGGNKASRVTGEHFERLLEDAVKP